MTKIILSIVYTAPLPSLWQSILWAVYIQDCRGKQIIQATPSVQQLLCYIKQGLFIYIL